MAYTTGSSGQMTSDGFDDELRQRISEPHSSPKRGGLWSGEYADRKGYGMVREWQLCQKECVLPETLT